jgi:hypothetical protein
MQTEQVVENVGKKFGFSPKESQDLFYYYWKEHVLKNICLGDYEELHVLGLGKFRYSSVMLKRIMNSDKRVKSDEFKALLDKLITNLETSNSRRKWKR